MRKLLVCAVLIALLAIGAESSRVARQAEEEGDQGTAARVMNTLRSYYDQSLNTASGYLEDIRELKLEEKAKNLYVETTTAVRTYAGVVQDQLYHMVGSQ
ncbi:apolipoprotein C-II-like [Alosa pseudoharengus]|uniref:apolipoprotein C-II-like n=1 Tax=Alosa pseudoharengus TaxID=34774 RepID=UPI003F8A04A6